MPEDLIGENKLLRLLTRLLVEPALDTGVTEHLGHGKCETAGNPTGNTRNVRSRKALKGEPGEPTSGRRAAGTAVSNLG